MMDRRKRARLKRVLGSMRLNFIAFAALIVIAVIGISLIRSTLFDNAWETGTSMARNYAAEEQSSLTMYETLLTFGTASIDERTKQGWSREEMRQWTDIYFARLDSVLGEGVVDPYVVLDGEIIAAHPWDVDETYDVESTEWYQRAISADGKVIFTDLYTDVIYGKPVITIAQQCAYADAVMAFDILPENIRFQFDDLSMEAGDSFFLCDSRGQIIYADTGIELPREEVQAYLNSLVARISAGEVDGSGLNISDLDGQARAVYYARLNNGWYSIVTIPHSNILGDFSWLKMCLILMIALFLLLIAGMTWRDMRIGERIERTNETVRVLGNS